MEEVKLWHIERIAAGTSATAVDPLQNTETEKILEDALFDDSSLLESGLTLIARQLPTINGPLDLLGIDQDGRLVVFELKRGELTRGAVAQVVDYASAIDAMDRNELAQHVRLRASSPGIEEIQNLIEWHGENFPGGAEALNQPPRMVLVGLGVDSRARRMVSFLASLGVDIDLLTFNAFAHSNAVFLARQVEVEAQTIKKEKVASTGWSREEVEATMNQAAAESGVLDLIHEVRSFLSANLRTNHLGNTKKSGVTFYLPAIFDDDQSAAYRSYASITVDSSLKGKFKFFLSFRAIRAGGEPVKRFLEKHKATKSTHSKQKFEQSMLLISQVNWPQLQQDLKPALISIADALASGSAHKTLVDDYYDEAGTSIK